MFCDACGEALQPGQGYCKRCGKQVIGTVVAGSGRVARHTHLLGILWIAYEVTQGERRRFRHAGQDRDDRGIARQAAGSLGDEFGEREPVSHFKPSPRFQDALQLGRAAAGFDHERLEPV